MSKFLKILFSNMTTLAALLLFAVSMAYATFVENDYGTPVARQMIYDTWWFELVMLILALNFIGNIHRYQLFRKKKLGILIFHVAFILILLGAFVTRYTGYEGLVHIREGQITDYSISQKRYLNILVNWEGGTWELREQPGISILKQPSIAETVGDSKNPLQIRINKFVPDAVQTLVAGHDLEEVMEIVAVKEGERISLFLTSGGNTHLNGYELTFNNQKPGAINIEKNGPFYLIKSPEHLSLMEMASQKAGWLKEGEQDTLRVRTLYQSGRLNFVVKTIHKGKKLDYTTTDDEGMAKQAADLLFVDLLSRRTKKQVILAAVDGVYSPLQETKIGNYLVRLSYGPRQVKFPFSVRLVDFQLERYPGSTSPSSYASEVLIEDKEEKISYRISMNNVLDYAGYRFFQASYDLDEQGTILSVNKDLWGTIVTYLGYILMGLGMMITLFGKNSRFQKVAKDLDQLRLSKALLFVAVTIAPSSLAAVDGEKGESAVVSTIGYIDANHAEVFGRLLVQDMDGRIKPINTLASEFLRKLTRRTSYKLESGSQSFKLDCNQTFLSIHQNPAVWQYQPIIRVDAKKVEPILKQLDLDGKSMLSFRDLIDEEGNYRLMRMVELAQRKKPSERSESDKEIIKLDERFNILFQALSGNFLKVFPKPNDPNNTWISGSFFDGGFQKEDSIFVRGILPAYYSDITEAQKTGEWAKASDKLIYIKTFQNVMGEEVIPQAGRMKAELLYNKLNIFNRLFPFYWVLGIFLITLAVILVFSNKSIWKMAYTFGVYTTFILFTAQTAAMILRWYAGGYPPWSNGYEMIILVSWSLFLIGFILYRKSNFILPVVNLFGGTLLFVSFLDWLNPEITNLVPVLKSYWLKIHVAIIVSSYAPLALSALLGVLSLIFMTAGMVTRSDQLRKSTTELTYINELSMTIGLFMLAVGTFLGGVWANESWGRYWGWDPKETWALISIIVYAMVLHLRLIPKFRGQYTFNLASVIAFFSIVMTSFGVNYYLSGLHSYAAGDPVPVPQFVYWVVGAVFLIAVAPVITGGKSFQKDLA